MDAYIIAAILFLSGAGLTALGRWDYKTAEQNIPKHAALLHAACAGCFYTLAAACYAAGLFSFYLATKG